CQDVKHFTIKHYAGSVDYNIDSWVEKNRDVVENAVLENQLLSLLEMLASTSAHFIRCVVPNYERVPNKVDGPLVINQLRCNGVLEGIRICREGYPSRLLFADFVTRYNMLVRGAPKTGRGAAEICASAAIAESRYEIGKTKIFCKIGVISEVSRKFLILRN
uniref:Myosin motor domain-containing protein n=1 Tax=Angiostrongylus cantonensis TaxID=6313 RepID=A0A0K0D358_ANGCA